MSNLVGPIDPAKLIAEHQGDARLMPQTIVALAKHLMKSQSALVRAKRLCDEALPKFNWGKSALDGNAIQLLNEVPGEIARAITDGARE